LITFKDIASQSSDAFQTSHELRDNFRVHVSQGSAETLVKRGGITNNHSIAYSLINISAKNYQNQLVCVEVIVCNISVVFLRHSVYLLTPMDCAKLPHAKSPIPYCTPSEMTRQQRCKQYLKHIATRLLAHIYTVRPKLHLVDLLSTYYTSKVATNTQEIESMELAP